MEKNNIAPEQESLGALFRRVRLERSLEIQDVCQETRIPAKTVRAIEADDYGALPAQTFARGFYLLYARMLDLDQEAVLRRFSAEYDGNVVNSRDESVSPPSWQSKNLGTMAERPAITPGSIIGLSLLLLILIGAGISWYAGFNPATYASKWLRSLQEDQVEEPHSNAAPPAVSVPDMPGPGTAETGFGDTAAEALPPQIDLPPEAAAPVPADVTYQLVAEFPDAATITLIIDDEAAREMMLPAGTVTTWQAQENITLELPSNTTARLYLNGAPLPLPPSTGERITISVPEYLLD